MTEDVAGAWRAERSGGGIRVRRRRRDGAWIGNLRRIVDQRRAIRRPATIRDPAERLRAHLAQPYGEDARKLHSWVGPSERLAEVFVIRGRQSIGRGEPPMELRRHRAGERGVEFLRRVHVTQPGDLE